MKQKLFVFMILLFMVSLLADGVPPIGSGTDGNPYQVATLDNLLWISTNSSSWGSYFIQTADIDASDTQNWNEGEGFSPIGHITIDNFTGNFDGQGQIIDGLYINRPTTEKVGLFGITHNANIENLGVINVDISGANDVGGLIGRLLESNINNCYSTGEVYGENFVAGLVGYNSNSTISNCHSSSNVSGDNLAGGIVGNNIWGSVISNCYSSGNINGNTHIGGIVGSNYFSNISNSHYNYEAILLNDLHTISIGALEDELYTEWFENDLNLDIDDYLTFNGSEYVISDISDLKKLLAFGQSNYHFFLDNDIDISTQDGFYIPFFSGFFDGNNHIIDNLNLNTNNSDMGMFGCVYDANIENLGLTNVDISGSSHVGGLVGNIEESIINNCYNSGDISGHSWVGGLVGGIWNTTITSSYSLGNVNSIGSYDGGGGGLVGFSYDSIITNCISTCSVNGEGDYVGGLVGVCSDGSISDSFSTGNVIGNDDVGGLVGYITYGHTISNSYSTGCVSGTTDIGGLVGIGEDADVYNSFWDMEASGVDFSDGGTGKTTEQMQDVATFTDLDTEGLDNPWDFVGNPFDDVANEDIWDIDNITNNGYPFLTATPMVFSEECKIENVKCKISNYPNPFNPSTVIEYVIVETNQVELNIYNIRGQLVKTLMNEQREPGIYQITWEGRDEYHNSVSSGIYFSVMKTGKEMISNRMVLLK